MQQQRFHSAALQDLCQQQVRFAPRERKVEQMLRAEQLMEELHPERRYSFEYLAFRLTGFRPEVTGQGETVTGAEAAEDLQRWIEELAASAGLRAEELPEGYFTVEELSRMFRVSTKTISRWRRRGLVGIPVILRGRKRVVFLNRSVERFVRQNREKVRRGERFSQMSVEERKEILERARRLAQAGATPTEVARRVARQMNRSTEAVRLVVKQHDQQHPHLAIFGDQRAPLDEQAKERLYQQYRRGESVTVLARRYGRTVSTVYRIINEVRARRVMELPLEYIYNPEFDQPNADRVILAPLPPGPEKQRKVRPPAGLPRYLASLYEVPLLTPEQERHLFRKFNYLKYKAAKLRQQIDPARPSSRLLSRIEKLYEEAVRTKNQIVQANLRLVVSIAKRHVGATDDFFDLISDGNMSLIRAVEKFDYARGFKFSTYASWAIMKNFARSIPEEFRHRERFRTSYDEMFQATADQRSDQYEQEAAQQLRKAQIARILSRLDEREQKIIISRFGLDPSQEPQTLKEVGEEMGVTKERVRQIEARALNKLRLAAQEEHLELPD